MSKNSKKTEVVEVKGKKYLKKGNQYTEINLEAKVFEPGTHIIHYNVDISDYSCLHCEEGWGMVYLGIPSLPKGYKYVNTIAANYYFFAFPSNFIHVFVNDVPVEVIPTYSSELDEFGYFEPGTPVKRLTLKQE